MDNPAHVGSAYMPYVYGCLRTYTESYKEVMENYVWMDPVTNEKKFNVIVDNIVEPHIFAFSCYIWSWKKALILSQLVKKKFPNCLIVFGGPQVPGKTNHFFYKYPWVDILVHKEGEETFSKILVENLRSIPDWTSIKGITFKGEENSDIYTGPTERIDLSKITKSIYELDYYKRLVKSFMESGASDNLTAMIETNRGCPYTCSYCTWGSSTASKIRKFTLDKVNQDLKCLTDFKVGTIFNADANFGILPRDEEISNMVIERKKQSGFPQTFLISYSKKMDDRIVNILKGLKESDTNLLKTASLSFQSLSPTVLKNISRSNLPAEKIIEYKKIFLQLRIATYTELILGLPGETFNSFTQGICKLLDYGIQDNIIIHLLVKMINSPLANDHQMEKFDLEFQEVDINENFIIFNKRKYFEKMEVIHQTGTMTNEELVDCFIFFLTVKILHTPAYLRNFATFIYNNYSVSYYNIYLYFFEFFIKKYFTHKITTTLIQNNKTYLTHLVLKVLIKNKKLFLVLLHDYLNAKGIPDNEEIISHVNKIEHSLNIDPPSEICNDMNFNFK